MTLLKEKVSGRDSDFKQIHDTDHSDELLLGKELVQTSLYSRTHSYESYDADKCGNHKSMP